MNGHQEIAFQSKKWLLASFFELLKTKDFQDISVTEVAENAGISRRTFYRMFKDKYDLLDYYTDQKLVQYLNLLQSYVGKELSMKAILILFLNFWWDEREYVQILVHRGLFHVVSQKIGQNASTVYRQFRAPWHIVGDAREIEFVTAFTFGGLWRVLEIWLSSKNPVQPEEIAQTIMTAVKQSLETGRFEELSNHDVKK